MKSGLRSLRVIKNSTIRKLGYGFLFTFHCNYGHILYHFREKARHWSKIAIFHAYPCKACIRPHRYCPRRNIATAFGSKTRMVWLLDGDISLMTCLAVSTQYRRATDGRHWRQQSARYA